MFVVFQNSKEANFLKVDLHHLHLDESEEVLFLIFEFIRNSLPGTYRSGVFQIEIVTGKGIHSKNGAVLLPYLMSSLKQQGHFICSSTEGRIICNIKH